MNNFIEATGLIHLLKTPHAGDTCWSKRVNAMLTWAKNAVSSFIQTNYKGFYVCNLIIINYH